MGLKEKMLEKGYAAIAKNLAKEARAAGSTPVGEVELIRLDDDGRKGTLLREIAAGFVGGELTPRAVQVLVARRGDQLQLYCHPSGALTALPGEHHALLAGGVPAAAWLQRGDDDVPYGPLRWRSQDGEFERTLNADESLVAASKKVSCEWHGTGVRKSLPVPVELRTLADGRTHVAMHAGSYGFWNNKVGFEVFANVVGQLARHLLPAEARAEDGFRTPFLFAALVPHEPPLEQGHS